MDATPAAAGPECSACLLPMQYQSKRGGRFVWQCFKCGRQLAVSGGTAEEGWSPPR